MREIKFRAWDEKSKRMFNVDVLAISPVMWDSGGTGVSLAYQPHIKVMQYTGLKDKNGKEIYEGDIVKGFYDEYNTYFNETNRIEFISDVKWINNGFGVRRLTANYEGRLKDYGYQLFWDAEKVEVIGNIYENPELLEGTK